MASPVWQSLRCHLQRLPKWDSLRGIKPKFQTAAILPKGCVSEVATRGMASGRKLVISPSRFEWNQFKNDMHFYLMLGIVPLGSVIFYANYFIGESELAEIPEGYEPKHWEYYKHPISRWFARYVYEDPVKSYEMEAAKHVYTFEAARHRAQMNRVKEAMKEHDDFRSYYFVPAVDPRFTDRVREVNEYKRHYEIGGKY